MLKDVGLTYGLLVLVAAGIGMLVAWGSENVALGAAAGGSLLTILAMLFTIALNLQRLKS